VVDSNTFQPSVSFGMVAGGQTASAPVLVTNSGTQVCTLSSIGINPNDQYNEFGLTGGPLSGINLNPNQSLNLTVTFTPATATPPLMRTADLSISAAGPSAPPVVIVLPLSGTLQ
jgi:hypothetical protein